MSRVGSEDQPVGSQRVLDGVRLAQETRIPGDLDCVSPPVPSRAAVPEAPSLYRPARGLADHQRGLGQQRCQRVNCRVQLTQVSGASGTGRGSRARKCTSAQSAISV